MLGKAIALMCFLASMLLVAESVELGKAVSLLCVQTFAKTGGLGRAGGLGVKG